MKKKNVFDILEDAENDSMDRLIDKCPEIPDAQLDRILAMSEKKFHAKMRDTKITQNNGGIDMMKNENTVEGVERKKRPAWLIPARIAASLILIAGVAIGSTVLLKKNFSKDSDSGETPLAVTVTTSTGTGTTFVSTDGNASSATTTLTTADITNEEETTLPVSETDPEAPDDTEFITPFVGMWDYQTSPDNTVSVNGVHTGIVVIFDNATYTYTDLNGYATAGTIKKAVEEIGGTEIFGLDFSGDSFIGNRAYYTESAPDELHFGNGDAARIVRIKETSISDNITKETAYEGVSNYCHANYDLSIAEEIPAIYGLMYGEESDTEYEVIFRSYTGSHMYFFVDKVTGSTRIFEENPITNTNEYFDTINIYDYLYQ